MKKVLLLSAFCTVCFTFCLAQTVSVPFDSHRWNTTSAQMIPEIYQGKKSILLHSGMIYLKDQVFLDGIIEVDISFPMQRSFPGVLFRLVDTANYEIFYVRPHQSGNPDATQYTPSYHNQASWQLYQGEGYGQAFTFRFNEWHHLKIDVYGFQAEVYIDDMQTPFMKIPELKHEWKNGSIGLMAGGLPVHFSNFKYTIREGRQPQRKPVPSNGTNGVITQWKVSEVINVNQYPKINELRSKLSFATRYTDPAGLLDFSPFSKLDKDTNTVLATATILSTKDQVKALSFGFSDKVAVFLNGTPLYEGSDIFLSRDYRFFGTIGYWDKVFLPLKKGINEICFLVSEKFGGWGLQAKFEDMENIKLE